MKFPIVFPTRPYSFGGSSPGAETLPSVQRNDLSDLTRTFAPREKLPAA